MTGRVVFHGAVLHVRGAEEHAGKFGCIAGHAWLRDELWPWCVVIEILFGSGLGQLSRGACVQLAKDFEAGGCHDHVLRTLGFEGGRVEIGDVVGGSTNICALSSISFAVRVRNRVARVAA